MKTKDEPAFPFQCQGPTTGPEIYYGMTKRDYFAAAALTGLCAQHEQLLAKHDLIAEFGTIGLDKLQANKAYRLADAMLAERDNGL